MPRWPTDPLTRDYHATVVAHAARDPEFRDALVREAAACIDNGEVGVARRLLAHIIGGLDAAKPPPEAERGA